MLSIKHNMYKKHLVGTGVKKQIGFAGFLFAIMLFLPTNVFADTATFYPTLDGYMGQDYGDCTTSTATWATIRGATGNDSNDSSTTLFPSYLWSSSVANDWCYMTRGGVLFDTSSLPDDATIISVTLSLYGESKGNTSGLSDFSYNVYSFTPASDSVIANTDYANFGSTVFATGVTYAGLSTAGYNDFPFNATGIAAVSLTGLTRLGLREATYDGPNNAPVYATFGANKQAFIEVYGSEQAGTSQDPMLVVNYTVPGGGGSASSTVLQYVDNPSQDIYQGMVLFMSAFWGIIWFFRKK